MDVTRTKQDKFMPQETRDNPYDVTLVVEDGKEFRAHRKVLSEASPFFDKLLNSGMRESKEGVIRLEMLTEAGLGAVLEFIYTGGVEMLAEDNARDLIEMADYLFIPQVKTFAAGVLAQKLNTSNCISSYYFAKRYQCEELVSDATKFIYANFTNVAKTEQFLNMSSEEVNKWISSDDINVSSEEDVVKIILTWIDHDKSERKKYFADLFRQVRLIYASRDYLFNDIVTHDVVNDNACCLELVKDAMEAIDFKNWKKYISFSPPRKSLATPVILVSRWTETNRKDWKLLSYFPSTYTWYEVCDIPWAPSQMVSCHGMLYFLKERGNRKLIRYDPFFDLWTDVPYKGKRDLQQIFVIEKNEDGIYALEKDNEISCPVCVSVGSGNAQEAPVRCGKQHLSYITKYKPESNSWEDILSVDFGRRTGMCLVAKDNFIYFIGGRIFDTGNLGVRIRISADVDRYELSKRQWDKLANLQERRFKASGGTTAHGKIFIFGGYENTFNRVFVKSCEVYNERTNEWQLIASPRLTESPCHDTASIVRVDDKVYLVESEVRGKIQCYDPDKDEWNVVTEIPEPTHQSNRRIRRDLLTTSCSMTVFTGCKLHWHRSQFQCSPPPWASIQDVALFFDEMVQFRTQSPQAPRSAVGRATNR